MRDLGICGKRGWQHSLYKNNMEEEGVKSDDKIKVTVKTPRDKKEVHVQGNGSVRQVKFSV